MADLDGGSPDQLATGAAEHRAQGLVHSQKSGVEPDHGDAVGSVGKRGLEHLRGLALRDLYRTLLADILTPRDLVLRPSAGVDRRDRLGLDRAAGAVLADVLGQDLAMGVPGNHVVRFGSGGLPSGCDHAFRRPTDEGVNPTSVHRGERPGD